MLLKAINFLFKEIASFKYALDGIFVFVKEEKHAILHTIGAITAISIAYLLGINKVDWCLILFAIGVVIISEILNSAIERLVDLSSPSYHPLAKKAKDLGAAGVLVASVLAVIVGLIIFIPYLWLYVCQSNYIS